MASLGGTKEEDVADSIEMSAVAPVYAMHPTSLAELNLPTFEVSLACSALTYPY